MQGSGHYEADGVPDMREALTGSINNQGGLSNSGDSVFLNDGSSDVASTSYGAEFGRGNSDVPTDLINDDGTVTPANLPLRSSDHDGMVVFIAKDEDADGVLNDEVPLVFDQALPQAGSERTYTLGDTAGRSCEQIIEAQDLGNGHTKFGCSNSAMEEWVEWVNLP
jgi:hypothetical protein